MSSTVLAGGFVDFASKYLPPVSSDEDGHLTRSESELWQSPSLQVLDVQRQMGPVGGPPSPLYLCLSDSRQVMWGVCAPETQPFQVVWDGDVEIGSCVTAVQYAICTAKNGHRVIVLLELRASALIQSVVGQPFIDSALYRLSDESLIARTAEQQAKVVTCQQLFDDPHTYQGKRWELCTRVLWKSVMRRSVQADSSSSNSGANFVFELKVVDHQGTAVQVVVRSTKRHTYDEVSVGTCVAIMSGIILFAELEEGQSSANPQPNQLVVNIAGERGSIRLLQELADVPRTAERELGLAGTGFEEVAAVLGGTHNVGDVVSVRGVIVRAGLTDTVNTRRGQTSRRTLNIRDSNGSASIDVTLWDSHATRSQQDIQVGTTWCFRGVTVSMYSSQRVLSTRFTSEVYPHRQSAVHDGTVVATQQQLPTADGASIPVVHRFANASLSERTPVFARVEHVKYPYLYKACKACGRKMADKCSQCGGGNAEVRYLISLQLTDGVDCLWATGFTLVGEAFFGETVQQFVQHHENDSEYGKRIALRSIGTPVLVHLVQPANGGDAHILDLKHVNMNEAAKFLINVYETGQ